MGLLKRLFGQPKYDKSVLDVARKAFPGGRDQFLAESREVQGLIGSGITVEHAGKILSGVKAMMVQGGDTSRDRLVGYMLARHPQLGEAAANRVFEYVRDNVEGRPLFEPTAPPSRPVSPRRLTVGDHAVVIDARNSFTGISKEYEWIESHFGKRKQDWDLVVQSVESDSHRAYDVMVIRTRDGQEHSIRFDITSFYH